MLDASKYTVLDFETTGLVKRIGIVSCCIMVYENNKRVHHDYFECNPEAIIDPKAFETHHIPQERVDKLPPFSEFWDRIKPYIENHLIVGHNVQKYDVLSVLIPNLEYYCFALPTLEVVDTMLLAKKTLQLRTFDGKHNLESCCKYYDIPIENHHHAAYDVYMTQKVFAHEYNDLRGEIEPLIFEGDYDPRKGETESDVLPF